MPYEQRGVKREGFHGYDDAFEGRRPGYLIIHQWTGLTDYEKLRARMLELARAGMRLSGVMSFHPRLVAGDGMEGKAEYVLAKDLCLHGAIHPFVPRQMWPRSEQR